MNVAASLDANVLIRLIVKDDEQQLVAARKALAHYSRRSQTLFVPITVALELEWVLRSVYKFAKSDVLNAFSSLLTTLDLVFESEDALEQSLATYEEVTADFGECLHLALASKARALPFLTFDLKAAKALGAKLLK